MDKGHLTINLKGKLMDFGIPKIMGILNVTSDSFYEGSRCKTKEDIRRRILKIIDEGTDIIDVGACSTRPGSNPVSEKGELERLSEALDIIREIDSEIPVSVDTYRAEVAKICVNDFGANIINDISGGEIDEDMWETVAKLQVPYVLTHLRGTPGNMQTLTQYDDVTAEVISDLSKKIFSLRRLGINDIILDPGFGFAKTILQNFQLLDELGNFCEMGLPVMVGLSRKSMIYKTLDCDPENALEGTIALQAIALDRGADILRVHDVRPAASIVKLNMELKQSREEF